MILNVWTVTAAFLAVVGAALGLGAAAVAIRGLARVRGGAEASRLEESEDRAHLLALVLGVLLGVRFLAWPLFYLLLKSYVPELSGFGVMCAFGVTRIQPELVSALQWTKPALLLGLGFWFLLELAARRVAVPVLARTRFALALSLALLALAESGLELAYLVRDKAGRPVTCCTQFLETDAAQVAGALPTGRWTGELAVYFALNAVVIGAALWSRRRAPRSSGRVTLAAALGAAGLLNLLVTQRTWLDAVAPRVLQLPYHHCVYELLTDTPALGLAAGLSVLGNGALLWPVGLELIGRQAREPVARLAAGVYGACALLLASSLLVVAVHVA